MLPKIKMYETEDGNLLTADEVCDMLHYALKIDVLPDEPEFDKMAFKCSGILRIKNASVIDLIKLGKTNLAIDLYIASFDGNKIPYKFYEIRRLLQKLEIIYEDYRFNKMEDNDENCD